MGDRTQKSWDHLKKHQNLYSLLCVVSALVGIYLDYRAGIAAIDKENEQIESKAQEIDTQRVQTGTELQRNMELVYKRALEVENRLTVLETKMEKVEDDNSSFWRMLVNSHSEEPPVRHSWKLTSGGAESSPEDHSGDGIPDLEDFNPSWAGDKGEPPESLEQTEIRPVF